MKSSSSIAPALSLEAGRGKQKETLVGIKKIRSTGCFCGATDTRNTMSADAVGVANGLPGNNEHRWVRFLWATPPQAAGGGAQRHEEEVRGGGAEGEDVEKERP